MRMSNRLIRIYLTNILIHCILYLFHIIIDVIYFAGLDPSLVGLSLAYIITLIGMFQYCVRVSAEVENLVRS